MQTDPERSDAIRRFEEQYAENPDSLVFARLADLHRKAGRPERALEVLDEGLERHPDYLSAHIVRARCLRALDRPGESEEVFRHVLDLDGENLVALRSLAEIAWERGDEGAARDRLRELLELDPSNEEARDLLAEIREGPGGGEVPDAEGGDADHGEALGRREREVGAEDDPFAPPSDADPAPDAGAEAGGDVGGDAAGPDDTGGGEGEPADGERRGGEDVIIEPSSRREPFEDRETFDGRESEGEPGDRAFDVEAVESGPEADETGSDDGAEASGEAAGGPPTDATAGDDESGRWWDFLESGGGSDEWESEGEADRKAVAPEPDETTAGPAPDDDAGSPAVGPASEAEELRAQIEELRMQAEQETDLSDAEEDLATETLANLYETQGFYREAVEMYEELVEQRPDDGDLRRRLERARSALQGTEEASRKAGAAGTGEASAGEVGQAGGPADAGELPTARESTVTAADELRSVLRGDASPGERSAAGP